MERHYERWLGEEHLPAELILLLCFARMEDGSSGAAIDSFLPLAAALSGIPSDDASYIFFKMFAIGPDPRQGHKSILAHTAQLYTEASQLDPAKILVTSTFSNARDKAFSQRLRNGAGFKIDIWLPAIALYGYCALLMSHLAMQMGPAGSEEPLLLARLNSYNQLLAMVAEATADGGTFVIQDLAIDPALPSCIIHGFELLQSAIAFTVFHEMAHIELGHLDLTPTDSNDCRAREFKADARGFLRLHQFDWPNPWLPLVGAITTFIARSLVSKGPDNEGSKTHPSIVSRVNALMDLNDKRMNFRSGGSKSFLDPMLHLVIGNLHDRDRSFAWFQRSRRDVLGVPPDHEFEFTRINFKSQGRTEVKDARSARPEARDLLAPPAYDPPTKSDRAK